MPIYEFECSKGTITERLVSVDTREIECPKCHEKAKRIMSLCTFLLKGGGWFADGYESKRNQSN
jgi:putative FmdB family regulatory protein